MPRLLWKDPFWDGKRKPFTIALSMSAVLLILLFFVNLSYLYGSFFNDGSRTKAFNVLAVDYDGGVIGQSLKEAYATVQGNEFPTLQWRLAVQYPTIEDVQNAVCKGDYWAAIVAQAGSSDRLSAALEGGAAAAQYNSSNTLTFVYNEVHYPTVQQGFILSNMQTMIGIAGSEYNSLNGTAAASYLNTSDANAVLALLNPISASSINIAPISQGTRVLYNTVSLILPIIQQFFAVMALNGISQQFEIYNYLATWQIGLTRLIFSLVYTVLASLTTIGYIWAFKESWDVSDHQFALSWVAMWLYMHVNFLVLDTATAFIPMQFMSFFVLTWAIINITSTIFPFELSPGFYRWGYALPGHQIVTILFQIWSGGCNNQLARALPVLFAWEVFGGAAAVLGATHRNRVARQSIWTEAMKDSSESTMPLDGSNAAFGDSFSLRDSARGTKGIDPRLGGETPDSSSYPPSGIVENMQSKGFDQFELDTRPSARTE